MDARRNRRCSRWSRRCSAWRNRWHRKMRAMRWQSPSAMQRMRRFSLWRLALEVSCSVLLLVIVLLVARCAGFTAASPRRQPQAELFESRFPAALPPWVEITIEKTGAGQYKEDPKDEDPLKFQLTGCGIEPDLQPRRQAGSFLASAGIGPESRQHGDEDFSL